MIVSVRLCGCCGLTKDSEQPLQHYPHHQHISLKQKGTTHLHTAKNLHCIIPKKDLHR